MSWSITGPAPVPAAPAGPAGTASTTCCSKVKNNYFTEMCSGSEAGSYLRLMDFVYHSTLGLRVIKNNKKVQRFGSSVSGCGLRVQEVRGWGIGNRVRFKG